MSEHLPGRPTWDCLSCDKPWPCDPARERMAAESPDVASLAFLMTRYLEDYAQEVQPWPPGEAYDRFIGWVRTSTVRAA